MSIKVLAVPDANEANHPMQYNENGEPFSYLMLFNAGQELAFADTITELVSLLIPNYLDIADDAVVEHTTERVLYAIRAQVQAQAQIMTNFDHGLATPEELAVLTGSRDTPPEIGDVWECPIPIVLIEEFYYPYDQERPHPRGVPRDGGAAIAEVYPDGANTEVENPNIIWLSARDELDFMQGLASLGLIGFYTVDDDIEPVDPASVDTTGIVRTRYSTTPADGDGLDDALDSILGT